MKRQSVRLRRKPMKDGGYSLYLDVYAEGRRSYEFLKLYLLPGKTRAERAKNEETLWTAEQVRARREIEVEDGRLGLHRAKRRGVDLFAYMECIAKTKKGDSWLSALTNLRAYAECDRLDIGMVSRAWAKGFCDWLKGRGIKDSSGSLYFSKLVACLNQAVEEGILEKNPAKGAADFKPLPARRMYLTAEEVARLAATPCTERSEVTANAFLFACLTGLRHSDVRALRWSDIREEAGYTRLLFTQQKTGGVEYMDVNREASAILARQRERAGDADQVFAGLDQRGSCNWFLARWVAKAGITKHITFHCARHTFAVLLLEAGVDIYTVSKLLGHKSVAVTQIYAKVLDKSKRAAVDALPSVLG